MMKAALGITQRWLRLPGRRDLTTVWSGALRSSLLLVLLVVGLSASALWSLTQGAVSLGGPEIIQALKAGPASLTEAAIIVWQIRLPRLLLGFLIGGALAAAGSLTQAMFRNPLAAPGLVGVQAGAALGAAFMIVLGVRVAPGLDLAQWLPAGAFIGGLITTGLIYLIARSGQASTALATLLLTGIAVNALAGAATGFLIYLADDQQLRDLTFWTLGSLAGADWSAVSLAASLIGPILLGMPLLGKTLNVLALGEAQAAHLGVATEACKILGIVLVALSVGVSVAFAGMIGFIGLVVPHCARYLMGPDHRFLIPAAALLGAILLALADGLARTMVSPAELPIGILTSLLGGPFFLWLVIQRQRKESW